MVGPYPWLALALAHTPHRTPHIERMPPAARQPPGRVLAASARVECRSSIVELWGQRPARADDDERREVISYFPLSLFRSLRHVSFSATLGL